MRRRPPLLLGGSLFVLIIALVLAGWGLSREPFGQPVRLSTGEVLHLRAVTFGTAHTWTPQNWWQRLLGPLLPASLASKPYTPNFYVQRNAPPSLIAWFTGPSTPLSGSRGRSVFVADETGQEYGRASGLYEWRRSEPRVEYLQAPLPKRGHTVSLRFYDGAGHVSGTVTFPVPASAARMNAAATAANTSDLHPPVPPASASPCPVVGRAGEVSATLVEVTTGLSGGGSTRSRPEVLLARRPAPAGPGDIPWTRVALRLAPGSEGWTPVILSLRNAEGDTAQRSWQRAQNGLYWFGIHGWIGQEGGPLAARVMLQRQDDSTFRPEQLWHVPGVAVPRDGAETPLNLSKTIDGVSLELHALAARRTPTGPGRRDFEKSPYLRLRANGLGRGHLLTVWAIDERGRRSDAELKAYGGIHGPYEYRIRMPISRDAKTVTLHLAIHGGYETRLMDFVARPEHRKAEP